MIADARNGDIKPNLLHDDDMPQLAADNSDDNDDSPYNEHLPSRAHRAADPNNTSKQSLRLSRPDRYFSSTHRTELMIADARNGDIKPNLLHDDDMPQLEADDSDDNDYSPYNEHLPSRAHRAADPNSTSKQ
ncbi:hypothetical protein R1sor_008617 [Riccia sorocarpa]|uniref:Uncharacterized protein n=1 Tax=Riccia sorocarpa TaxID=122646 RepID=A0ABD3HVL6_9MARC